MSDKEQDEKKPEPDKSRDANGVIWISIGTTMGVGMGVAFGAAFDNIGMGIAIGVAVGTGAGVAIMAFVNASNRK